MGDSGEAPWRVDPNALTALRLEQARAALDKGDAQLAIIEAEELLDQDPDNPDALFLVGDAALDLGDAPGAHAAFSRYLEITPDDPGALSGLAVACFELTDFPGCVAAAQQATKIEPELGEAWYYLGLAAERVGDEQEARRAFARATRLDPETWPALKPGSQTQWNAALGKALKLLPAPIKGWYDHVHLEVHTFPSLEDLRSTQPPLPPTLPSLYDGEPPDGATDPWSTYPRCVKLFRGNLERAALFGEDLPHTVAEALRAEALDWLGLSPDAHPLRT